MFSVSVNDERLQRPPDNREGRIRRGVRLPEGRHREDVRDEVSGQEEDQDEAGGDPRAEREDHALAGEHRRRLPVHRVHDLRLPHARQALLHIGPHERGRPALPPQPARGLQRDRDEVLRGGSNFRYDVHFCPDRRPVPRRHRVVQKINRLLEPPFGQPRNANDGRFNSSLRTEITFR